MIDVKILREQPDLVKKAAEKKGYSIDIERIAGLDARRRELKQQADADTALRQVIEDTYKVYLGRVTMHKLATDASLETTFGDL